VANKDYYGITCVVSKSGKTENLRVSIDKQTDQIGVEIFSLR